MGNKSDFLKNAILTRYLITSPAYLALLDSDSTELDAASYGRQEIVVSAPSSGQTQNSDPIIFPTPLEDWGTVARWAIMDSDSDGNILWTDEFPISKTINTDDTPFTVGIGGITIKEF